MTKPWMQMLGLVMKANRLATGEEAVLQAVRNGKAKLVIVADDASPNTVKKMKDKCRSYRIPLVQSGNREALGRSVGKSERVIIGILDSGFAESLRKKIDSVEARSSDDRL